MTEKQFQEEVNRIDFDRLASFLHSLDTPCYESALFKAVFPELNICTAAPLDLYQHHFVLYHALYLMKEDFEQQGRYLYIHFMRTYLIEYPEDGRCRWYEPLTGRFCNAFCEHDPVYCSFHRNQVGETELDVLSEKYFYLDPSNFYALNEETAAAFLNGTWEILANFESFKKSFEILGIPETSDMARIRKRFRTLAKIHHPDTGGETAEQFTRINNAYRLLMRVLPAFNV